MSFKESDDSNYDEDEEMTTIYIFRHGQADEENNHVIDYGYAVKNIKRLINGQYPRKIVSVDHPLDNGSRRFRETYEPLLSDEESVQLVERIFPDFFTDDFSQLESGTKFIFIGTLWNDIYPVLYHLGLSRFIELDDGTTDEEDRLSMGLNRSVNRGKKVEAWSRWAYRNGLKLEIPTSILRENIFKKMLENDNSRSVYTTEMILKKIKELCDEEQWDLDILPFSKEESDIEYLMKFQKYIDSGFQYQSQLFQNPEVFLISQAVNRCLKLLEIFEKTNQKFFWDDDDDDDDQNFIKSWRLSKIKEAIYLTMENIIKKYSGDRKTKAIEILRIFENLVDPYFSEQRGILKFNIRTLTNKIAENDWKEQGDDTDWNFIFGV
jgi:hypothetical protein